MELLKKLFLPITAPLKFIQENFKAMLFLLLIFVLFAPLSEEKLAPNNLQTISLVGPIMEVSEVISQIEKAQKNDKIRGVLLIVNSPGGAVAPSVEVAYAIKRLKRIKPVVVYAAGTIASGSYYASIWADKIIANPGSMVGSIGVIMQSADASVLLSKIGIKSQSVQAGKYKKVGTPDRPWTDYEINELNKVIYSTYDMFTKDVAQARGLDYNKRDLYANAHIFTAHQAKEVGLIDEVGVIYDAKKALVTMTKVKEPIWNKEDKFDKFMKKLTASSVVLLHTYFPPLVLK
ncbi:signal peptide peptidase SppA [Sulfurimonas sp. SAG-AH-194-I05]|nr:signal peptide peptidase SppA [Sulfurimonas sp. SAG-AH-194-I05]MDF1875944.1 signal peptide peptidase SppA [Sulfurimonas sp. SAG-AH-194-I05]